VDRADAPLRSSTPCSAAVSKGSSLGGMRNAGSYPGSGSKITTRCIGCKRRIAWGDRCAKCKQEMAQRLHRKRKPR
jgi:hypothetical protein